MKAET